MSHEQQVQLFQLLRESIEHQIKLVNDHPVYARGYYQGALVGILTSLKLSDEQLSVIQKTIDFNMSHNPTLS